jgi:hypothetical protein
MFGFAKMVNLAKSPEQVKGEIATSVPAAADMPEPKVPVYPWGTCIKLEDDTLEKLGLDDGLPAVGETLQFLAMARVTSVSV